MLSVRVLTNRETADRLAAVLLADPTVSNVTRLTGQGGTEEVFLFEVARENANNLTRTLKHLGVPEDGAVVITDPLVVLSAAADRAEQEWDATSISPS